MPDVTVLGGGLAGVECCHQLLQEGLSVLLIDAKPTRLAVYQEETLAELVCSNSLKSDLPTTAAGLLKDELRRLGSLLLEVAEKTRVAAGAALAVDRRAFSKQVTERLLGHRKLRYRAERLERLPDVQGPLVVATGPLTEEGLARQLAGSDRLHFYDATAPIVAADSLDLEKIFAAARYDKGMPDYLNSPLNQREYESLVRELVQARTVALADYDDRLFADCQPVERLAARGPDTLRYGPLRPVGLKDPRSGERPYAVVQLRREDQEGQMWGLVGFQTRLLFTEQERVFRQLPGLEAAEFLRFGVMHRNTFVHGPRVLLAGNRLKARPDVFLAGQITGLEGYMEAAASGLIVGRVVAALVRGLPLEQALERIPPAGTLTGQLMRYVTQSPSADFQPMNANFGLLPLDASAPRQKLARRAWYLARSRELLPGEAS